MIPARADEIRSAYLFDLRYLKNDRLMLVAFLRKGVARVLWTTRAQKKAGGKPGLGSDLRSELRNIILWRWLCLTPFFSKSRGAWCQLSFIGCADYFSV